MLNVAQHSVDQVMFGVLKPHPTVVAEITTMLLGLQSAGITVTQLLGCAVMITVIAKHVPKLLKTFQISEWYVGNFFDSVLKWSV
jgi:hypothetical protein